MCTSRISLCPRTALHIFLIVLSIQCKRSYSLSTHYPLLTATESSGSYLHLIFCADGRKRPEPINKALADIFPLRHNNFQPVLRWINRDLGSPSPPLPPVLFWGQRLRGWGKGPPPRSGKLGIEFISNLLLLCTQNCKVSLERPVSVLRRYSPLLTKGSMFNF